MKKTNLIRNTIGAAALSALAALGIGCSKDGADKIPAPIEQPPEQPQSQQLEMYETLMEHFGALDKTKWPELQDRVIYTPSGAVTAKQKILFGGLEPVFTKHDGNVSDFLHAPANSQLYKWQVDFDGGLISSVDSNDSLTYIVNHNLNICGKDYRITEANASSADPKKIAIGLMRGKAEFLLNEDNTKTITVDGKEYEVELMGTYINTDGSYSARLKVNGEDLGLVQQGNLGFLADGQFIGVMRATNGLAELALGAQKLCLMDSDMADGKLDDHVSAWGIDGSFGWFEKVYAMIDAERLGDGSIKINSISYQLQADNDIFVPRDSKLSDEVGKAKSLFELVYGHLEDWTSSQVDVEPSQATNGQFMYNLGFINREGIYMAFPFVYNDNGTIKWGGRPSGTVLSNLVTKEATSETDFNVTPGDYVVLNGSQDFTHVMLYESIDKNSRQLRFCDCGAGNFECTYDANTGEASIIRGGQTFKVKVDLAGSSLAVDQNADGNFNGSEVEMVDFYGGRIKKGDITDNKVAMAVFRTPAERLESKVTDELVGLKFDAVDNQNIAFNLGGDLHMFEDVFEYRGLSRAGVYGDERKDAVNNFGRLMSPERQPLTHVTLEKIE